MSKGAKDDKGRDTKKGKFLIEQSRRLRVDNLGISRSI